MTRGIKFVSALVVGLAAVSWLASSVVQRTTTSWFEKDIRLRSTLVVNGARQGLASEWDNPSGLRRILVEITHDERMLAAGAYRPGAGLIASTFGFPDLLTTCRLDQRIPPVDDVIESATPWHGTAALPEGRVHVSSVPVFDGARGLGAIVLLQDLSFVERREAMTRRFLLIGFAVLALSASAVTTLASYWSRRSWNDGLRRLLRGDLERPEFRPFLRDVRELVDRILAEKEATRAEGSWTPQRLRSSLVRYLHGERVVLVANREPYIHTHGRDGAIEVRHPASGLVTALEPVMRACSGVWIAHGSGSADRETVDKSDRVRVPPGDESYLLRRVWLTEEEEKGYYYGFSNEGIWPLAHLAHARPIFRGEDWTFYEKVNEKFAAAVATEVDLDDPIVLVQDYHFALAPRYIRRHLPRATVMMFWHIPWPNAERFGICPWRNEILDGMLGSSILGFHTQVHCNNFVDSVDRFLEARIDRERNAVIRDGKTTLVRPYPISLEWPSRWIDSSPSVQECRAMIRSTLGLGSDGLVGVGVDRMDYTKGIEERLLAVERLLERFPDLLGRFVFVQLAAPSRAIIERYRQLGDDVERIAARVNLRFGRDGYRPIVLLREHHEPPDVFRYYRGADLCYVSSLHDGMNLVAKEFVAARDDERGALVLSQFTGAARELSEALIVNPYDLDEASSALAAALAMSAEEQRDRMRQMRAHLADFNVYRWAGKMVMDAADLRKRDRLAGRLTNPAGRRSMNL